MAKIKLGPVITDISGSIKDTVFTRYCRSSYATKSKAGVYQNPQSPRQAEVRTATKAASSMWNDTLTPQQRNNWDTYAQTIEPQQDVPHSTLNIIPQNRGIMSGFNSFVGAYLRVVLADIPLPVNFLDSPLGQTPPSAPVSLRASWEPDFIPNYALRFDGVDERINLGNVLGYEYNQPFAWEFFIRVVGTLAYQDIIAKVTTPIDRGYECYIQSDKLKFAIFRAGGAEWIMMSRTFTTTGAWKHIVMTYNGNNNANGIKIYVDAVVGQVVASNVPMTGTIISTDPLKFAQRNEQAARFLDGDLCCIRNYNRNLVQADVNTLFAAGAGIYGADPLGDGSCQGAWMFCTGHNHILHDISGNGYYGDLINMEPADWIAGKVPCPLVTKHLLVEWTDPVIAIPDSRVRVWAKTRELGVHRQQVTAINLDVEEALVRDVRMAQGKSHCPSDFPGHYTIQADVVQPNGLKSMPSHSVEVVVP